VIEHHELLQGYSGPLTTVAWSANGKQLATGSSDGAVRIWDVPSRQLLFTLEGHTRPVQAVAWNAEGNQIAEGGFDGTIHIWNIQTGARLCSFVANVGTNDPPTHGGVSVLAWHPNGQYLASGGYDGKVNVWEIRSSCAERKYQWTISQHLPVSLLAWSGNDQQLMTSDGLSIQLYSTHSGKMLTLLPFEQRILSLALSPDKLRVALALDIGEAGQVVELRDAATFQIRLRIQDMPCQLKAAQSLVWSPNGQQLAGICGNNKVIFWDSRTGRTVSDLSSEVTGLTWSPDSQQIATVGEDGIVRLWSYQE
jgi:WD40 repeat protein